MTLEKWSPNQEAVVLIKTKNEVERQQIEGVAQEIRTKRIFNPADETDKREVDARSRDVVRSLLHTESVEDAYNIMQDPNKTPAQKELTEQNIDKLGKAVFLVLNYGGRQDLAERVLAGSQSVEEILPEPLKGLGDAVVNQLIQSQEVRSVLEEVDLVRSRIDFSDPNEVRDFVAEIDDVKSKLIRMKVSGQYNQEVIMAKTYLLALKNKYSLAPAPVVDNTAVVDAVNRVAGIDKERDEIRQMYDFYYSTLLHETSMDDNPFSNLAPEWMKKDPDKTLILKQIQLANACFNKKKLGNALADSLFDIKGEATFGASNELMQKLYEKVPGVRECLEGFVQDFFVAGVENRQFVLKLKGVDGNSEAVKNKFLDLRKLQISMRDGLVGPGKKFNSGNLEKDLMEATRAVSIAWNLLYVGHTFEDADTTKCLKGEVSVAQAWNIMHPAQKALDKLIKPDPDDARTEETFGGQKGQLLIRQIERSKFDRESRDFINSYKLGKFRPFPERLLTSYMVHTRVNVEGGSKKITMAQALLEGKKIDFLKDGLNNDSWGSYYDFASASRTLYDLTTGKTPLILEVNDGKASKEMIDWANTLADARNKLRKNELISPHINNKEFLLWSIVACVKGGVYVESSHLVMMTPKVFSQAQYDELDSFFGIRQLVNNQDEKEWVMRALNCDSPGSVKRRQSITGRGGILSIFGF